MHQRTAREGLLTRVPWRTLALFLGMFLSLMSCKKPSPPEDHTSPPYDPRNISRTKTSSYTPSLDVRGDRVAVVWKDSIQGNNWDIMYRERVGDAWGEILNLSDTPGYSDDPQVAIDVQGNVHVVWEESWHIYYRMKDPSGHWSPPRDLGPGSLPQIGTDVQGNVYVIWEHMGLWLREKTGNSWSERVGFAHGWADNPALSVTPDGHLYAVAEGGHSYTRDIYFYERPPGGEWFPYFNVTQNTSYCWAASVFGLPNGRAYVSWTEHGMNRIGYRVRNADGTWEDVDTLPGIQGGPFGSFIFGSGDTLLIVWNEKQENWEVYYRMKIGDQWGKIVNVTNTPGESFLGKPPKVRNGVLYVVWSDNSDGFFDIFYDEVPLHF